MQYRFRRSKCYVEHRVIMGREIWQVCVPNMWEIAVFENTNFFRIKVVSLIFLVRKKALDRQGYFEEFSCIRYHDIHGWFSPWR